MTGPSFPEPAASDDVLRVTDVRGYELCRAMFYLTAVKGIPRPENWKASLGTAIHEVMASLMRIIPERVPTMGDARVAIRSVLEKFGEQLAPSQMSSSALFSLMENAVRALSSEYSRLRLSHVLAVEQRSQRKLDPDLPSLSGCPDLVHHGGHIVDWKTTWHPWGRNFHRYLIQHQVYPWLLGFSSASFTYVVAVLSPSGEVRAASYSEQVDRAEILKGLSRARKALQFAKDNQPPEPPPRPCRFCPFAAQGGCQTLLVREHVEVHATQELDPSPDRYGDDVREGSASLSVWE